MVMQCPLYHVKRLSQFIHSSPHVSASTSFFSFFWAFDFPFCWHFSRPRDLTFTSDLFSAAFLLIMMMLLRGTTFSFFNLKLWKEVQCFVCDVAERYLTICFYRVSLRLSLPVEVSISFLSWVCNCSRKCILN